ncbi:5-oxoprolinase subunit PxpB [Winogradskyella sp.]|uniref:5-oxoprolinase subunit PxpB n=1 Tax=Winogradskyella sp. TaxID=1883156 RepID=UPI00261B6051|nr:5-oxoprolinase subunit PxpB [Winogradskyella sp.]
MDFKLRYSQYNERSILIEWPRIIDENILKSILKFKNKIMNKYIKQKIEIIHTYSSILIIYNFTIENINDKFFELKSLFETQGGDLEIASSTWEIPVCYDEEFGVDFENFSKEKGLIKQEVVKLHSESIYTVFFIGFLPGFLYLGGLNSKLHLDRKKTPKFDVKKGAVAIGGEQTGIYPQDSPGGWHIIGQTPVELFNSLHEIPCPIQAGDKVKFKSISKPEFIELKDRVSKSKFKLKSITPNA